MSEDDGSVLSQAYDRINISSFRNIGKLQIVGGKNHSKTSEYLLIGATIWKPYTCPRITHHILITLIPLIEVIALGGTFVSIIRLVFLIKEKHKKNRTTTSVSKNTKTKLVFHKNNYHAKFIYQNGELPFTMETAAWLRNSTKISLTTWAIPTSKWTLFNSHL